MQIEVETSHHQPLWGWISPQRTQSGVANHPSAMSRYPMLYSPENFFPSRRSSSFCRIAPWSLHKDPVGEAGIGSMSRVDGAWELPGTSKLLSLCKEAPVPSYKWAMMKKEVAFVGEIFQYGFVANALELQCPDDPQSTCARPCLEQCRLLSRVVGLIVWFTSTFQGNL